jgi:hypothetical protein
MLMNLKTPFSSKPFISLYQDFINGGEVYLRIVMSGFVRVLLMNINIFAVFCWSLVGSCYVYFDLWRGASAAGSLAGSSASFLVSFLAGSLASSSVSSLVNSLASSLVGSGCRYGFTVVVLKSVGLFINCTLHVSLSIPSNLYRPVHLPLCLVLPLCYMSMSKLGGRSWIVVIDGPFRWFSALLTCFFVLILMISSIAFFMAVIYYIVDNASGLNSLI